MYKAQRKSESFPHSFLAVFPLLVGNAKNFFIHSLHRFVLKKGSLHIAGF